MKKSIWIRILTALSGLLLIAGSLCALAETFFNVQITSAIGRVLNAGTPLAVLLALLTAIALCLLGVSCVMMLFPGRKQRRSGFVMQKGENGTIGVSVKSIEGLVETCVRMHEVVARAEISVLEKRDGIVILLNIEEAAGVNIPLAVGALQKQIKQYVTACTGVDVQEVRVMVENCEADAAGSPYVVQSAALLPAAAVTLQEEAPAELPAVEAPDEALPEEPAEPAVPVEEPVETDVELPVEPEPVQEPEEAEADVVPAVPVAAPVVVPAMPEISEEEDDRPLHQRLFGAEEQPAIVPAPPELVIAPAEDVEPEYIPEPEAEAVEDAAEEVPALAEAVDEDAVAQVAQAIAFDGVALYDASAEADATPGGEEIEPVDDVPTEEAEEEYAAEASAPAEEPADDEAEAAVWEDDADISDEQEMSHQL